MLLFFPTVILHSDEAIVVTSCSEIALELYYETIVNCSTSFLDFVSIERAALD